MSTNASRGTPHHTSHDGAAPNGVTRRGFLGASAGAVGAGVVGLLLGGTHWYWAAVGAVAAVSGNGRTVVGLPGGGGQG